MKFSNCIDPELVAGANEVSRLLVELQLSLITAESCTGGLVAALLAQTFDAGEILQGGFVTYTKDAKSQVLDVDPELLTREGAVTAAVASQMCSGALAHSIAELAVAVTGVLGPEPDEDGAPVGLIYWATARRGERPKVVSKNYGLIHPEQLRRHAVYEALQLVVSAARW